MSHSAYIAGTVTLLKITDNTAPYLTPSAGNLTFDAISSVKVKQPAKVVWKVTSTFTIHSNKYMWKKAVAVSHT